MKIDRIPIRVLRIGREYRFEPIDRARIPVGAPVEIPHSVLRLAESIARLTKPYAPFGDRVVSWISLDEGGQLLDRLTRLGLIALRTVHLIEVRHSQLELRVSRALVRRVERHELPELVRGENERLGRMLAHVRVADAKFGVRAIPALRIA